MGETGPTGQEGGTGPGGEAGTPGRSNYLTGPGLDIEIQSATIADDGQVTIRFKATDGEGIPLDRAGLFTEGSVSTRFLIAWLDEDDTGRPLQYTAYKTNGAGQASYDGAVSSDEAYTEIEEGVYEFRFGDPAVVADASRTHTIGFQAERTYEGERYSDNGVFHFVPAGGDVTVTRQVVETQTCNGCHNSLRIHGGTRREVDLCITCHNPQSVDPETGNTVDFAVMIHKIHSGAHLPSVEAGTPYQIIGYKSSVHDYSEVHFPQDTQNCATCHTAAAADADLAMTRPTQKSCGSCHDRTSFESTVPDATWTLHSGGVQPDSACINCHPATGTPSLTVAPVSEAHRTRKNDPSFNDDLVVEIVSIENTAVGMTPEMVFSVHTDGTPRDLFANPIRINARIGGPTTDYLWDKSYTVINTSTTAPGGWVTAAGATLVADGANYRYTFPEPVPTPAGEAGPYDNYGLAMEVIGASVIINEKSNYLTGQNPMAFFTTVPGGEVEPRREVVDTAKCNSCHLELGAHGSGARRNADYCVFCHNSEKTNATRMPWWEGQTRTPESVDFKVMIHKIHMGPQLTQHYELGGYPTANATNPDGNRHIFSEIPNPGYVEDCQTCHKPGTEKLPMTANALPTRWETWSCDEPLGADGDDFCQNTVTNRILVDSWYVAPTTSVCTSCHDSDTTYAHANLNTWTAPSGDAVEACATCHAPGAAFDTANYHRLTP